MKEFFDVCEWIFGILFWASRRETRPSDVCCPALCDHPKIEAILKLMSLRNAFFKEAWAAEKEALQSSEHSGVP